MKEPKKAHSEYLSISYFYHFCQGVSLYSYSDRKYVEAAHQAQQSMPALVFPLLWLIGKLPGSKSAINSSVHPSNRLLYRFVQLWQRGAGADQNLACQRYDMSWTGRQSIAEQIQTQTTVYTLSKLQLL